MDIYDTTYEWLWEAIPWNHSGYSNRKSVVFFLTSTFDFVINSTPVFFENVTYSTTPKKIVTYSITSKKNCDLFHNLRKKIVTYSTAPKKLWPFPQQQNKLWPFPQQQNKLWPIPYHKKQLWLIPQKHLTFLLPIME